MLLTLERGEKSWRTHLAARRCTIYLLMPGFEGTMHFPKQHYESIVPEKSGINRFSASHDIDLFYLIHSS